MKTMMKITLAFSLIIGLSFSAHAAGGDTITISSSDTNPGPDLEFTPSGNTLIVEATTATAYYIGAASDKTTSDNGLEYCMVSGYNGYYQKVQGTDNDVTTAGTAGTAPSGWAAMGGAEAEAEE